MSALRDELRRRLHAAADPAKAPAMQAYMKSAMPFLGIQAVPLRTLCKECFSDCAWDSIDEWLGDVAAIWHGASHREERYAAIELAKHKAARGFQTLDALPLYREMIVTGAWWDLVDNIAPSLIYGLLRNERDMMSAILRGWAVDDDMWVRRASIIAQLQAKDQTDLALLYDCIEPSMASKEFFLRKAIGWALRQYARTDAAEVARYVAANEKRLSPLSRREALKHIS